jgi:MFS family permease
MGSVLGAIIVPGLYMLVPTWYLFFLSATVLVFPLIIIVYFRSESVERQASQKNEWKPAFESSNIKHIALICGVAFLLYADQIYQWPLEPFVVSFIGEDLFSLLLIGFIIINGIGIVIAGMISHKYDKKKVLLYNIILAGVLLLMAPFVNIWLFLGLYGVLQILGGFLIVNLISLMIDVSKKQVLIFQIIAASIALAKLVLVPLGTYLSGVLETEWIIFIAGVLFLLGVIPLMGIHTK